MRYSKEVRERAFVLLREKKNPAQVGTIIAKEFSLVVPIQTINLWHKKVFGVSHAEKRRDVDPTVAGKQRLIRFKLRTETDETILDNILQLLS